MKLIYTPGGEVMQKLTSFLRLNADGCSSESRFTKLSQPTFYKTVMKMLRTLCMVYLACIAPASAQELNSEYSIQHFTDENGLPQNSVKGIAEDNAGFIWLCTEGGLVRFDGRKFYTYDRSNSELENVRFFGIQPDLGGNPGKMFAMAESWQTMQIRSGKARFDSSYFFNSMKRISFALDRINGIYISSGIPNAILAQNDSSTNNYIVLSRMNAGTFYLIKPEKIRYYRNLKVSWEQKFNRGSLQNFFTLKGILYCLNIDGTVMRFSSTGFDLIDIDGDIRQELVYAGNKKEFRLYWNNISDQAFILSGNRFYKLDQRRKDALHTEMILDGFDFVNTNIEKVHYNEKYKRLFLGSTTSGFYTVRPKEFQTLRFSLKDGENVFYAQAPYTNNSVLTPDGIILGVDTTKGARNKVYSGLVKSMSDWKTHDTRSMFIDRQGRIWVKGGNGVQLFADRGTKRIGYWRTYDEVQSMYQGFDGRIWLGLKHKGLYYLEESGVGDPKKFQMPAVPSISFILQAKEDELWLGSEFGLYRTNLRNPKLELIHGTEKLHIRSIYVTPSSPEQLFFTTYEAGVFLYSGGGLTQFPVDAKRYMAAAHCIVEDKKGFFWIPTNRGLFEVAKRDLLAYAALPEKERITARGPFYQYYAKENGFNSNEFNGGCQPCMLRLPNGKVSLPSINGLVWFLPEAITPELPTAEIFIDKIEANGQLIDAKNDSARLPGAPKNIRISFSSPFFGNAQNLHLSYAMMENEKSPGLNDWQEVDNQNLIVSFSSLNYGAHTLFIRKPAGFGLGNITVKKIRFTVLPLWYETVWAKLVFILSGGAVIYFYTRLRTAYLKKRNAELEAKVNSRTEELEEVLQSLQHSETELNKQLHIRTRLVASISHDIKSPMLYLEASALDLEKMMSNKNYSSAIKTSKEISVALKSVRRLLDNMLAYIKTQVDEKHIGLEQVSVRPIIQEKRELFSQMARNQGNKFVIRIDSELSVYTSRQLFAIIIHNLIDNANKYTCNGIIKVVTDKYLHQTRLTIADTGPGLPEHLIEWLNGPHTLETMERAMLLSNRQTGLGLIIVKEIAVMLALEIFAENVDGARIHLLVKNS